MKRLDVSAYLSLYHMTSLEVAQTIMKDILDTAGIQAACGIGTNLYLAKIALDITAKPSDNFTGCLDEKSYQDTLWNHCPLTDFWRISVSLHVGYSHTCPNSPARGTASLPMDTNSDSVMIPSVIELYERIADLGSPIRRIDISCGE